MGCGCDNCKTIGREFNLDLEFINYIKPTLEAMFIEHDMNKSISVIESNISNKSDIHNALRKAYIAGFNKRADIKDNIKIRRE